MEQCPTCGCVPQSDPFAGARAVKLAGQRERARKAAQMRRDGMTYGQIAIRLKYANPGSARKSILRLEEV